VSQQQQQQQKQQQQDLFICPVIAKDLKFTRKGFILKIDRSASLYSSSDERLKLETSPFQIFYD